MLPNLLIHSLCEFSEIILATLDIAGTVDVIEIGSEYGGMSSILADWLEARSGRLRCVDPCPKPEFLSWVATKPGVEHIAAPSLEVLTHLQAADAWIIDGDHNWYTVFHELQQIFANTWAAGKHPLIFLHDVSWPNARRDSYYAPERIPREFLQPYTFHAGALIDRVSTVPGRGFRGGSHFAYANIEGGPRNGVLTAVEDAITAEINAGHGLAWCRVPAVFGLGIIFDTETPWCASLIKYLLPFHENKLLATLERNRLDIYMRVLEMQDNFA